MAIPFALEAVHSIGIKGVHQHAELSGHNSTWHLRPIKDKDQGAKWLELPIKHHHGDVGTDPPGQPAPA